MKRYINYKIVNLRDGNFGAVRVECGTESLYTGHIYSSYEEAYKTAKAFLGGLEPTDETTHH